MIWGENPLFLETPKLDFPEFPRDVVRTIQDPGWSSHPSSVTESGDKAHLSFKLEKTTGRDFPVFLLEKNTWRNNSQLAKQ